jgi:hypothetical protein
MKKKGIRVINGIVIFIVLGLVLYFSLKDNFGEIIKLISSINPIWIILAIMGVCLYRFFSGLSTYLLVRNTGYKISLYKVFQISFIILFFHGITPFATGGQPMEVYYLHREKVPVEKATNIVLQNFIMYQTALILVGLVTISCNHFMHLFPFNSLMRKLVVLGFLINFAIWLVTFLLAFGKRSSTKVVEWLIRFLHKIKIIKNIDKYLGKLEEFSDKFYDSAVALRKNKKLLVEAVLVNVVSLLVNYSIPFVLAIGLGVKGINIWEVIVATSYTMIIGSFVPIPGGTGGVEYGFMYFFKYLLKGSILSALMLIWRFITYYIGIVIGAGVLMFYRRKSNDV